MKSTIVQIVSGLVLSSFVFLGVLASVPLVGAATIFFNDFEDGDHLGWLESTTGGSGSTGVELHNSSQMAFIQHTGNDFHSLSYDFSYAANQHLSFDMHTVAHSADVSTGGALVHAGSGVTLSFLDVFNTTLGSVSLTYRTDPASLGENSILVDTSQHNYDLLMSDYASQAGMDAADPIVKVSLSFWAWGVTSFHGHASNATVWFDNVTISGEPVNTPVDLSGTIKTPDSTDVCAMVLASGQFMFSCDPIGVFSLTDLPREQDGTVKRQIYADGFFPKIDILTGKTDEAVVMTRSGTCPSYKTPYNPGFVPGSAGKRIDIAGKVILQDSQTPICAMVLANGKRMFSCDGTGSYALNIPLDNNGQFKLQVYADGFAPTVQTFDEFKTSNDVRMARATECQ